VKSIPYVISAEEFFTHLPRIIWHLDDPMADAAAVPLWFAAREARKHVKVVLAGEGGECLHDASVDHGTVSLSANGRAS